MATSQGHPGFMQSAFQKEFAEFVAFVGGTDLDKKIRKVDQKLRPLPADARSLFGDRFFFHEQFTEFASGSTPFKLDTSDLRAVRAASLIAGVNRVKRSLSATGASRLRAMVLDNLQPDRDIRQIEHEFRAWTHCSQKGFDIAFAEFEELGNFDLLLEKAGQKIEVECKTIAEDTGIQIKFELNVNLTENFRKTIQKRTPVDQTGLFTMQLKRPSDACRDLASQFKKALSGEDAAAFENDDFSLRFSARPDWEALNESGRIGDLQRQILAELSSEARCVTRVKNRIIGLIVLPHRPSILNERIVDVLKDAARQCSSNNPAVIWLHFVGMKQTFFATLARYSSDGRGLGLNKLVADALHPEEGSKDRTHVQRIRFSSDPDVLSQNLAFGPDRLLAPAVSMGEYFMTYPILMRSLRSRRTFSRSPFVHIGGT